MRRSEHEPGLPLVLPTGLKRQGLGSFELSKNRHGRFRDHNAFCQLFDSVLRRCIVEGLVQGEGFATDASMIKADAQRQRSYPDDALNPEPAAMRKTMTYYQGRGDEWPTKVLMNILVSKSILQIRVAVVARLQRKHG